MGLVTVFQSEVYGDIYLTAKRTIDASVLERVQEYNSLDSEKVAETLFEEAAEPQQQLVSLDPDEEPAPASSATDDDIEMAEKELNIEGERDV